ncbi:C-X-C motif chemokine 13 isoform X1 [Brachyistius frenatus]|uniref:C-X-C motif chemokine 13 isoform X1 n=1 Tax=Brachyistius frenatus TaxID=100188 RepID=UPI0037E82DF7
MNKPLLLLTLLTLSSCIASLHAFTRMGCRCKGTISHPVPPSVIKKIEVTPASGHCRWTEIIVTRRNGSKICINPEAKWLPELFSILQKNNVTSRSTTRPPAASTSNV